MKYGLLAQVACRTRLKPQGTQISREPAGAAKALRVCVGRVARSQRGSAMARFVNPRAS